MAYVDENLLPAERVVYRAHLHPIIYAVPAFASLAGIALVIFALLQEGAAPLLWVGLLLLVIAAIFGISSYAQATSSEFAVTNRRVVIKVGVVRRHTLELLLQQVEGIGVDQTVIGRMLNIGSLVVIGTGGTKEQFTNIANPLEFRHQVQAQTAEILEPRYAPSAAPLPTAAYTGPFCSACGTQNPAEASFCFKCGQRLLRA
jgi:uncharacterized membrane protein YdbT with pleckstrin-like domain